MTHNPPKQNWITELVSALAPGDHAVFDADGTLWSGDVGEAFHEALVAEGVLAPATLVEYARLHALDLVAAYAYGTRVLAGLEVPWLRARAAAFFEAEFAGRVFPEMRALLAALAVAGVTPWIASASYRALVDPGARALGIPEARVFAMTLHEEGGRTTDQLALPLVTHEGKAEVLRARFAPLPALVAGNSVNDLPMLRLARKAALVVNAKPGRDPTTGDDLVAETTTRGWLARVLIAPAAGTRGTGWSDTSTP